MRSNLSFSSAGGSKNVFSASTFPGLALDLSLFAGGIFGYLIGIDTPGKFTQSGRAAGEPRLFDIGIWMK